MTLLQDPELGTPRQPPLPLTRQRWLLDRAVLHDTLGALGARASMLCGRGLGLILISRALGSEQFGVYALLLATYNIALTLAAFGIESTHVYWAGRRPDRARLLLGNSLLLGGVFGSIGALLLFGVVVSLWDRIFAGATGVAVLVTCAAVPISVTHQACVGIVEGLGWFRYYGAVEALKWGSYLAALAVLYGRHHLDVAGALGSHFGAVALAGAVHVAVLGLRSRGKLLLRPRLLLPSIRMGWRMLGVHMAHVLSLRLDVYAVRLLGSLAQAGSYALATQLTELLLHLARSFRIVMFSGSARGRDAGTLRLRTLLRWIVVAACLLPLVLVAARHGLLHRFLGETSIGSETALLLRAPGALAVAMTLVVTGGFLGRGQVGLALRANLLPLPVFLALVWPLAASWNASAGAAAAFSIAAVVQVAWVASLARRDRGRLSQTNGGRTSS